MEDTEFLNPHQVDSPRPRPIVLQRQSATDSDPSNDSEEVSVQTKDPTFLSL